MQGRGAEQRRRHAEEWSESELPPGLGRALEALAHRVVELRAALVQLEDALAGSPERLAVDGDAGIQVWTGQPASPGTAHPRTRSPASDGLTPRQADVLDLLATGSSNAEIAQSLRISVNTVERHVSNIFAKVGARNRVDAATYALTRHATSPEVTEVTAAEGIP